VATGSLTDISRHIGVLPQPDAALQSPTLHNRHPASQASSGQSGAIRVEDEPKSDTPIVIVVRYRVAFRSRAVSRPVVKAAAPKDTLISRTNERGPILRNARDVACEDILAPLPNVPDMS
jgi:hypothetical protein